MSMAHVAEPTHSSRNKHFVLAEFFRGYGWQLMAALFCFCFGVAFTLNIQPVGDGLWYWYGALWRGGRLMYADMQLPLQPLFVLLTAWAQKLLGLSWIASKVLAVIQLLAYCVGLFLVVDLIRWRNWQKAILLTASFGMTMMASYFRFDDYHITCYCFEIYSIYLLLRIEKSGNSGWIPLLGIMSGLSISDRLNDGAALFAVTAVVLFFVIPTHRLRSVIMLSLVTVITLLCVVLLSGDSLQHWIFYSITSAAGIKGAAGSLLIAPFKFPFSMIKMLGIYPKLAICVVYACVFIWLCIDSFVRAEKVKSRALNRYTSVGILIITLVVSLWLQRDGEQNTAIAIVGVLICYLIGSVVVFRVLSYLAIGKPCSWDRKELFLLFPFVQLLAGAVTSGRSVLEAYPAIAILFIVVPLSLGSFVLPVWFKSSYIPLLVLVLFSAVVTKTLYPYHWHHFSDRALFEYRTWYDHPIYGRMYIERDQLDLMKSVCSNISRQAAPSELLSITNPYANYFCGVPPWHEYVQTWYDTASKKTIDKLISELRSAPPKWIIYQRGEDTMTIHEYVFLGGKQLPHRALDELIMNSIKIGKWAVVQRTPFEKADWILIRTSI